MANFMLANSRLQIVDYSGDVAYTTAFSSSYSEADNRIYGILGMASTAIGGALDQANLHALVDAPSINTTGKPPLLRLYLNNLPTLSTAINTTISLGFFRGDDGVRDSGESGVDLYDLKVSITQSSDGGINIAALDQSTTGNKVPANVHYSDPTKPDLKLSIPFYTTDRVAEAYQQDGKYILDFYFFNFLAKLAGLGLEKKLVEGDYHFVIDLGDGFSLINLTGETIDKIVLSLPIDATPTRPTALDHDFTNARPTGEVTISGTASVGSTLQAGNTLVDPDGLGNIIYQWLANGEPIEGQTGETLLIAENMVGKNIGVLVTYVDLGGTTESVPSTVMSVASISELAIAHYWGDPSKNISDVLMVNDLPSKESSVSDKSAITLSDVLTTLKYYLGKTQLTGYAAQAADYNDDGKTTLSDVLAILKAYLGKSNPPVWEFAAVSDSSPVEYVGILKGDVNGSWMPMG